MGALRVVVDDVDESVEAFSAAGYEVAQRWGPPFAILTGPGPDLWVSGPQTSAARSSSQLGGDLAVSAAVRPVLEVDDLRSAVEALVRAGWESVTTVVAGPGGAQQLVRRGPVVLEVFAGG
jgi:hypothetical protein